ncbi:MAG TPA: GNAT family N-acetyltransferase [Anaerolineaceae bacterium]|nr:GNAT family N-acetyltransferase [Anaerolineaceae bacterium]
MSTFNFRVITPNSHDHILPMAQLAADAFSNGQYVEQYCEHYIGNSHYDWHTSRAVLDGDKVIHHWGVWGYAMRLESVQLKVGGIGAVVTHPEYRKQGVMHLAAQASFESLLQDGYDLSILRGRHYVKMGYARAWNYVTYRLKPEEMPKVELQQPYHPLTVEQVGEMDALYNQSHAEFTGTAIRPTFRSRHPDDLGIYAWFDERGKLAGYVRAFPEEGNAKTLMCLEAAGDPSQGLAVLADLCQKGEFERLAWFTLPHRHPMLQALRKGACIVEDRYFDISGWRVKIINLQGALKKLTPLLELRLAQSQFAGWHGALLLDGGNQKATLRIHLGKIEISSAQEAEHVLHGDAELGRFLIGSDEPDEIIRQGELACSGMAFPLVRVLFPNLHPMMSHGDEY